MSRKRKIILISLVALPLAAVFVVLLWPKTPAAPPQIIELPNGVVFQLAGVTFGTNHVLGTSAAKLVYQLPAPIQKFASKILGSHFPAVQVTRTTPQPALIVWFNATSTNRLRAPSWITATPSLLNQILVRLADEKGVESGAQVAFVYPGGVFARFAEFPVLPRRSRTIQIRFYVSDLTSPRIIGEIGSFKFPNPVYGKFPQWTPDTGPLVRKAGDLEVRLDKFLVGRRLAGPPITLADGQMASDYGNVHNGDRAETVFDISLNSPGGSNGSWLLQNARVSDATGNALDSSLTLMGTVSDRGSSGLSPMTGLGNSRRTLPGALWPNESAWKLRLEFKRITGFDSNELVTFKNVHVPARGATNKPGLRFQVGDAQVTLAEFSCDQAPSADYLEAVRRGASQFIPSPATTPNPLMPTFLRFEITGRRDSLAVDFVRMTTATQWSYDEAWTKLDGPGSEPRLTFNSWEPGVRVIGLSALSTNAQTVDITLSVQKTRSVEFLLKPPK
jgi:hypothetical protein